MLFRWGWRVTAAERIWHIYDSQGQILALALRYKSLKCFKLFPLRWEAERGSGAQKHLHGIHTRSAQPTPSVATQPTPSVATQPTPSVAE